MTSEILPQNCYILNIIWFLGKILYNPGVVKCLFGLSAKTKHFATVLYSFTFFVYRFELALKAIGEKIMKYIVVVEGEEPDLVLDDPDYLADLGIGKYKLKPDVDAQRVWRFLEYSDIEAFASSDLLVELELELGFWFSTLHANVVEVDQMPQFESGDEVLLAFYLDDFEGFDGFEYHIVKVR